MTIYDTVVSIHDGKAEYTQHHYTNTTSIEKAERSAIKNYGFNQKGHFNVHRRDKDGNPDVWEERLGYRLYELEGTQPAKIYVDGMSNSIDLSELAGRPVLPLFSKDADWVWQFDNDVAYWWFHGDMVVEVLKLGAKTSENDSCISILYWSYFDINKHTKAKSEAGWVVTKGELDE